MLLLEGFERLGFVLEPGVDNFGVEAIAHQVLGGLFHVLLECVFDRVRLFSSGCLFRLHRVMLVVQSIRGGAKAVQAKCLTHIISLSLNSGQNFVDLRVFIIKRLTVDKSVFSHPLNDLLVGFSIHLHATDGQIFDLGKEIVVWLGDSTLVIL